MSNAIDMQLIADFGGTMLWPMIALSNIAQGSAVLGMSYLQRKDSDAQEVNIPSLISCYLGVTEPAMFGVNLKYNFPFICAMIGSCLAAIVCVVTKTTANAIGIGGLPGILSIQPAYMINFAICMVIAIAVPFVLTVVVGKKKLNVNDSNAKINTNAAEEIATNDNVKVSSNIKLSAFLSGEAIDITEVSDDVFSKKIVGDGIAIEPTDEILVAPADGKVTLVMEGSNHACAMKLNDGTEILLHIGLDTVNMHGDGFTPFVKAGDRVRKGDKLIAFSQKKIKEAGYKATTILVITETTKEKTTQFFTGKQVSAGKDVVATIGGK